MVETVAYFNGEWVPQDEVRIQPFDRGFYVGDAVFDLTRTFDGRSFKMPEHVDRLYRSLKYARIDSGLTAEEMIEVSEEGIRRNEAARLSGAGDWHVWQAVTRGTGATRAVDVAATHGQYRAKLITLALDQEWSVGVASNFIHLDLSLIHI